MTTYVRFRYQLRKMQTRYPATVPIANRPRDEKGASWHITADWVAWLGSVQSERANRYLLRPASGWVNAVAGDGTPISECLTMAGNVAQANDYTRGFYVLDALAPLSPFPDPADLLHFHRFTCTDPFLHVLPPADGTLVVGYPFIINGPAFIHESHVEVFDHVPEPVWPKTTIPQPFDLVILRGTVVRQSPNGNKVFVCAADTYGRTENVVGRWIQIGSQRWVEESGVRHI